MSIVSWIFMIVLNAIYVKLLINISIYYRMASFSFGETLGYIIALVCLLVMPTWAVLTGFFRREELEGEAKKEHLELMGMEETDEVAIKVFAINLKDIIYYIIFNVITLIIFMKLAV